MASRTKRVIGIHQADTKGEEWLIKFSRPISQLEVEGLENLINRALASK